MSRKIIKLNVDQISQVAIHSSTSSEFDENAIDSMVASIVLHGVIKPIIVRPLTNEEFDAVDDINKEAYAADECYGIIDGNTRFEAVRRLLRNQVDNVSSRIAAIVSYDDGEDAREMLQGF